MRTFFLCLFLFLSFICFSQKIRGFGTVGIDLKAKGADFNSVNVGAGIEFIVFYKLKPEVEISYYFAGLNARTEENELGKEISRLERSVIAQNISFSPKITFEDFDSELNEGFFQIFPIYNITRVQAKGFYYIENKGFAALKLSDSEKFTEIGHSFGIGIGLYFNFSEKNSQSFGLNLVFQNIDLGNAVNNLKFTKGTYNTQQTIGLELKYYFSFVKKKIKN